MPSYAFAGPVQHTANSIFPQSGNAHVRFQNLAFALLLFPSDFFFLLTEVWPKWQSHTHE